jgi:methyl-accepting chemotaxis protein
VGFLQQDRSIRFRVTLVLAVVAVVAVGAMGAVSFQLGVSTLERQAVDHLTLVRDLKGRHVEQYFRTIRDQLVTMSADPTVVEALREFASAAAELADSPGAGFLAREEMEQALRLHYQNEFLPRLEASVRTPPVLSGYWPRDDVAVRLQHLYIADNPYAVGSKHLLETSGARTRYDAAHERYHELFRDFQERFGYYDIFLVAGTGRRVVYSVFKEADFGTSLLTGPYRESGLAQATEAALQSPVATGSRLVDFQAYPPSYGAQASFIASPVMEGDEVLGVLAFQMPVARINDTMADGQRGFGQTGEAYLVGPDGALRTESRFLVDDLQEYLAAIRAAGVDEAVVEAIAAQQSAIGLQPARTDGVTRALNGETGVARIRDYRAVEVLSSFRPLDIEDLDWVVMSEIDVAEALAPVGALSRRLLITFAAIIPLLGALALWFAGNLVRPIEALSVRAQALAEGDLGQPVAIDRGDEIGDLARSFESMRVSLRDLVLRQNRSIEALSAPLIPIQDDVVVLPLVGDLDSDRCRRIADSLTGQLDQVQAHCAVLDVTGVPHVDAAAGEELARIARSARLMGARVIISGLGPESAAELADHPDIMAGVEIARTLRDAIKIATRGAE